MRWSADGLMHPPLKSNRHSTLPGVGFVFFNLGEGVCYETVIHLFSGKRAGLGQIFPGQIEIGLWQGGIASLHPIKESSQSDAEI